MDKRPVKINQKYFKEFFSVLFGVMFALFIDTMWSNHEHSVLAEKATHDILLEVKENHDKMDSLITRHEATQKKIRHLIKVIEEELDTVNVDNDLSLEFELIEDTAWETAQISGAVTYIKLEKLSKYNSLYKMQALYLNFIEKFMEHSFTGMQLLTEREKLGQMDYFIENTLMTEKRLLLQYEKILEGKK
ncbi:MULTISPECIES: hypothetical protein [Flammeovirga]|uniref:Uncharacterized protein n=1 Tax=Flammeovirga agarivorans TaxID=2726742 RepID=A0A7X8SJM6_9BACT|nr:MULTISPECIES: hypothetical protein [Flammeovirga]NLR91362.1 hypothetical protein [Flammeovirga agarivorans]